MIFTLCAAAAFGMAAADADGGMFREQFAANMQNPPRILLEKVWGKEVEASSAAELERDRDVLLGTVTVPAEQLPLSIVVDYAGWELRVTERLGGKES